METVGPFGGTEGCEWSDGIFSGVKQIILHVGTRINSIQIEYDLNGKSIWSEQHGSPDCECGEECTIKLDYPNEFLISISGQYAGEGDHVNVRSLILQSNKRKYGPYGVEEGEHFSTLSTSGKIIGFLGRSQNYLNAIGAYIEPHDFISVGPFGGLGGHQWDDGTYTTVRQIILHAGSRINSIQIEYDQNGKSKWSEKHGSPDCECGEEYTIKLDYPNEFLVSISGHYAGVSSDHVNIRSLTIQSNRKKYGPYGMEEGEKFSTLSTNGKIIGFFGRSDIYVNAIGVHFERHSFQSVGPFGGHDGNPWDDGIYSTIRQIILRHGDVIDSIQIEYDNNGQSKWSEKHGGNKGDIRDEVKLDYPKEFLVSVSGYYIEYYGHVVVRSLTIHSNKKIYGPYGKEQGNHFSTSSKIGKIVGFHGRNGSFLDSIGAYLEPRRILSLGPFGGHGGNQWDDGTYTAIRQIIIHHGDVVDSILIEYDNNGESKWSEKHGKSEGGKRELVKLDYPNEFLISISGYYIQYYSHVVVRSLTIQSNKKQYGPYGREQGEHFSTSTTTGKIIGFHGRSGSFLDSIGAYFEPLSVPIRPLPYA